MVEKVLCHRATNGTLHETWYEAAEAEATAHVLAMLPTWPEGSVDRAAIAKDVAKSIFIDRDKETTIAMGSLLRLFQQAPAADPDETELKQRHDAGAIPLDEFPRVLQSRRDRKPWFPIFAGGKQ